ncbi:DNA-binding response regulator [Paenibacillus baekrokdamisoli]|uniref:DNA-binding response regulator n=1 Tax=Paenibacillus baekrokdamisoli TaxID=1712516 RepID=A0A3G9IW09_9BACL|nr:response regulator transcription factor [Paenibacillus baekrokdamisoli]MBB3072033.1 two-component system response regulator ResD [Paenibacillus baekrokdamisoli]BBH20335.1 DNA-binding response regulator [Paenibacillus baekrokdamisoli]
MEERAERLLIVDDEERIRKLLRMYLEKEKYIIDETDNGSMALQQALHVDYDLIVLDIMLPGMNGLDICRRLKSVKQTPILMLTASGNENERLEGFKVGADDYVVKPFSPREVAYRIKAIVNRSSAIPFTSRNRSSCSSIILNPIVIEPAGRRVLVEGTQVHMALKEYDLLYYLALHPGVVFTREELLQAVWEHDYTKSGDYRTVDTHIKWVREKLSPISKKAGNLIQTIWGIGYCVRDA